MRSNRERTQKNAKTKILIVFPRVLPWFKPEPRAFTELYASVRVLYPVWGYFLRGMREPAAGGERAERQGDPGVVAALGLEKRSRWRPWLFWIVIGAVLVAAFLGISRYWRERQHDRMPRYQTARVERGDIEVIVTATGTLQGLNTVEVGAEVSGRVAQVGVDFNDRVKKGQVLAEIDPEQSKAAVDEATARVSEAQAAIHQARATLIEAEQNAARAAQQLPQGLISQRDVDAAHAARERAKANVESAEAAAVVARATLKSARSRLDKTQILAPIDGVVLSRLVEPGQTVTAGFQTPVLFKLTEDLRRMSLYVYVDEADVGRVREGQTASFTVDAYPDKVFPSRLKSLRNEPKTEQNVVTYEAVLEVDNDALLLRPGMTATATIRSDVRKDVVTIPNAALRFVPPDLEEERRRGTSATRRVWVLEGDKPVAIPVQTGVSDGERSELRTGKLSPGQALLVDVMEPKP
jgi:HlyD family secretion protein